MSHRRSSPMDQNLLKNHGKVLNCWRYNQVQWTKSHQSMADFSAHLWDSSNFSACHMKFLDDLYLRGRCRGGNALAIFASALTDDSWCENVPFFDGSTGISSLFMAKHGEHVAEMDQKKQKNTLTVFRVLTFGGARIAAPCAHCGGCILSSTM